MLFRSSFTKILEKFKLAQQQNEFKDLDETDLFLSSLEIINGYNEYKDKEIEPEKWERIRKHFLFNRDWTLWSDKK